MISMFVSLLLSLVVTTGLQPVSARRTISKKHIVQTLREVAAPREPDATTMAPSNTSGEVAASNASREVWDVAASLAESGVAVMAPSRKTKASADRTFGNTPLSQQGAIGAGHRTFGNTPLSQQQDTAAVERTFGNTPLSQQQARKRAKSHGHEQQNSSPQEFEVGQVVKAVRLLKYGRSGDHPEHHEVLKPRRETDDALYTIPEGYLGIVEEYRPRPWPWQWPLRIRWGRNELVEFVGWATPDLLSRPGVPPPGARFYAPWG